MDEGNLKSQAGHHKLVVLAQGFLDTPLEGPQGKDWTIYSSYSMLLILGIFNYRTVSVGLRWRSRSH
jgi:hypothetical protein